MEIIIVENAYCSNNIPVQQPTKADRVKRPNGIKGETNFFCNTTKAVKARPAIEAILK